jgi:hypothetical protein
LEINNTFKLIHAYSQIKINYNNNLFL